MSLHPHLGGTLPRKLFDMRVRSARYEVVMDDLSTDNNRGAKSYYGFKKSLPRKIELECKLHGIALAQTFLHESIHAVYAESSILQGPEGTGPTEEQYVDEASHGIIDLFLDNPHVLDWWLNLLMEDRRPPKPRCEIVDLAAKRTDQMHVDENDVLWSKRREGMEI